MSAMETYHGHVRTPNDAIILFEACRTGLLPRVQRRLSEKERQQIKSGSVFVWDEREAGMRRWTDGKSWSASRVSGSFLTYREMEGKRGGNGFPAKKSSNKSDSGSKDGSDEDGPDGYRYKPDGLMKQSFSITTSQGQHLHLISYYARSSPTAQVLMQPSQDPSLRHIRPQKGMYPESSVNEQSNVPAVTRGPMPGSPYTTAPHVGSPYARAGAPLPPYAIQLPHGTWPPTPQGTPPYSPYHAPPAGYIAHSPHPYYHYPHPAYPAGTVFDRPPPGLPPPPPMANGHPYAQPHLAPAPHHPPNVSPRVQQAAHNGPPAATPGLPPHPYAQIEPPQSRPALPAPTTSGPELPPVNTSSAPPTNGATAAQQPATNMQAEMQRPKSAEAQPQPAASETNGTAPPQAKTFPSIHALVNGTADSNESKSDASATSRHGSRSPNSALQHVKERNSGYGEDSKALRSLDKAFMVR
ncbi:Gti1/Pac2 family-domain-containing protein [Macrophomina phaseolina]|uniref:Gti1/Pac2 family-domain-containing protein n=1 Tax=Macrophomina phaseolina TaxID=35725 RepID=A0ABQ8GL44_9PEZI|nr:Gti1/Pac2 family-domain-containing protein [Macrophomina phaseolina]